MKFFPQGGIDRRVEYALKAVLVLAFSHFLYRYVSAYLEYHNPVHLIYACMEAITVVSILFRTMPRSRAVGVVATGAALLGTFLPLAFEVTNRALMPALSIILIYLGATAAAAGYASLNTSFGIGAALREVKINWMYRIVRHPIYASYIPTHIGLVLGNYSVFNLCLMLCLWCIMVVRIHYEEKELMQDEQYRTYQKEVRYRLIPGVY